MRTFQLINKGDGYCMTASTDPDGIVEFQNCAQFGADPMFPRQIVAIDPMTLQVSFPKIVIKISEPGKYVRPSRCLEATADGSVRNKACSTSSPYYNNQRFMFYGSIYRNAFSMKFPDKCVSRDTTRPGGYLRLDKCSNFVGANLFTINYYKNHIVSAGGAYCLIAPPTGDPYFWACDKVLKNPATQWERQGNRLKSLYNDKYLDVNSDTLRITMSSFNSASTSQEFVLDPENVFECDDGDACTREGWYGSECVPLDEYGFPDKCNGEGCVPGLITCNDGKDNTIDYCLPSEGCKSIVSSLKEDDADDTTDQLVNLLQEVLTNNDNAVSRRRLAMTSSLAIAPFIPNSETRLSYFFEDVADIANDPVNLNKILTWIRAKLISTSTGLCWKRSYGRGAGKGIDVCPQGLEQIGLLCYDPCPAGYERFGVDCHQTCKTGWRNDGLFCRLAEYGRGGGYPWQWGDPAFNMGPAWGRCHNDHGNGNCEWWGALVYPKCADGFEPFGCCICRPKPFSCSSHGYSSHQVDLSCGKQIILGNPRPLQCPDDLEQDGLFCYPKCEAGMIGVGPVCWGTCGDMFDCGAGK